MSRVPPRTSLHAPPLIRVLAELDVLPASESTLSVAERLGQWLDFTQAIELYAALAPSTDATSAASNAPRTPSGASSLADAVSATRADLTTAITGNYVHTGRLRIRLPIPDAGAPLEIAADYTPYQRYYLAHQREMESRIGSLRHEARAHVAAQGQTGAALADIDAAFEAVLSARERELLARVPTLLQTRFTRLYRAHQQALNGVDDPAGWLAPDAWLGRFCREMQSVLLAELELRLQIVSGLLAAALTPHSKQVVTPT